MDTLTGIAKALGTEAIKQVRRSNEAQKLIRGKQLLVVQPGHWLLDALCQFKRTKFDADIRHVQASIEGSSIQEAKDWCIGDLLMSLQHVEPRTSSDVNTISEWATIIGTMYSELLPQYEPFLVEVGLTFCLSEWSSKPGASKTDVAGFEAFFFQQLANAHATQQWFQCQFFLDSLDLLSMVPYFYKQKITNTSLKELISICVMESRNDAGALARMLVERLAKEKNKAARDGWLAFLGDEVATVGSPQRSSSQRSLAILSSALMNPTQLSPSKHGYFPVAVQITGFGSHEFADHRAIVTAHANVENIYFPGYLYDGA